MIFSIILGFATIILSIILCAVIDKKIIPNLPKFASNVMHLSIQVIFTLILGSLGWYYMLIGSALASALLAWHTFK